MKTHKKNDNNSGARVKLRWTADLVEGFNPHFQFEIVEATLD